MFRLAAHHDRLARGGLALVMLTTSLDTSLVNASLPAVAGTFGASFQAARWVVLAYLLAVTSFSVMAGRLGDIVGRRRLLLTVIVLSALTSVLCAASPSLAWLIAARAAQGLFAGAAMTLAVAVVGDIPNGKTGRAMGQMAAMSALGTTLGPTLAGVLAHARGAVFLVNVPLGLAAVALLSRHLPASPRRAGVRARLNITGALLLAMTLSAYALSTTRASGGWTWLNAALLLAAGAGAGAFAVAQSRSAHPLLPLRLLCERGLKASLTANAVVTTVMMSTLIVGPFYLLRGLGLTAVSSGVALSIGPAAAALTAVVASRIVERVGAAQTAIGGLITVALGAVVLALLPASSGLPGYLGPLVLMTSGYAVFQTGNNTAAMADVADSQRGVVAGLLSLSRNLGLITGTSVMGAVFLQASGAHDLATASATGVQVATRVTFAAAGALIGVALVIALVSRSTLLTHSRKGTLSCPDIS